MRLLPFYWLALISLLLHGACHNDAEISYSAEIKPLLNQKCLRCHGGIRALGDFSLLFPEDALAINESGKPAIVPGKPGASEMIARLRNPDPELVMPQEGDLLTEAEISLLEKWIRKGAKFDEHWAYRPLVNPGVPRNDSPEWVNNPIDAFILEKMEQKNLKPNETADLHTLVRRLSFDLTGLPPQLDSLRMGLGETIDRQNLSKIIDLLLASPHYGEHMAALWLDLARYADSNGYEKDMGRSIWRFRDWVINAFNQDMPFDQFTIEQLAGDLLPNPTKEQLIATAFHRNTMTNTEGGTEDEEFRTLSVIDRVNTTLEVWQGTTIACVQCHAHPYDPFRHEDYYHLLAYFNNTQDADIDSEYPYLLEHSDSATAKMQEIAKQIKLLNPNDNLTSDSDLDKEAIRQLIFPRLFGDFADDFQEVLIQNNGRFNNSAYNANNQKHKKYYLVFSGINLDNLTDIRYNYFCRGDDARIDIYLDNLDGKPVCQTQMLEPASKDWDWNSTPVNNLSGTHDIIFHFVNTSGDFRTGVVDLAEIELVYQNQPLAQGVREAQDSLLQLYRQGTKTPLLKTRSELLKRQTHVFERGNYLVKGMEVDPALPKILNPNGLEVKDRLAFAKWLVSEHNSLTPRVIVNRIWAYVFGEGLVSTPEDFGTQGANPTHPELLEYLAYQFSHDWNWSTKRLMKEIVSSYIYQQSSRIDQEKMAIDPHNYLHSRAPRVRLSAEQIRDQALAISGLLNRSIGGESVMPPQPEGVWQVVYSSARWKANHLEDNYRRGLYTYWKRTTPYPSMIAFDSPSREFCVSKRIITNTPLQALVTLNDTVYLEAAEVLGEYMKEESGKDLASGISKGYQRALLDRPDTETMDILIKLYHQAEEAKATLISYQEPDRPARLAPFTVVANAIMNLDAFLTKS
ncbi:MAG: DUF1553 domain-containing protein [Saprospiraceae bacterium]|nr:DUF1553 domain-containing protein [Saprospiraceae bacterium]